MPPILTVTHDNCTYRRLSRAGPDGGQCSIASRGEVHTVIVEKSPFSPANWFVQKCQHRAGVPLLVAGPLISLLAKFIWRVAAQVFLVLNDEDALAHGALLWNLARVGSSI